MRTRCETCGRTWGAETPLGLKAEATVTSCEVCDGVRSYLEDRLRYAPLEPTNDVLGKLLPENVYTEADLTRSDPREAATAGPAEA